MGCRGAERGLRRPLEVAVTGDLTGRVELIEQGSAGGDIKLQDLFSRQVLQFHHERTKTVSVRGDQDGFTR